MSRESKYFPTWCPCRVSTQIKFWFSSSELTKWEHSPSPVFLYFSFLLSEWTHLRWLGGQLLCLLSCQLYAGGVVRVSLTQNNHQWAKHHKMISFFTPLLFFFSFLWEKEKLNFACLTASFCTYSVINSTPAQCPLIDKPQRKTILCFIFYFFVNIGAVSLWSLILVSDTLTS